MLPMVLLGLALLEFGLRDCHFWKISQEESNPNCSYDNCVLVDLKKNNVVGTLPDEIGLWKVLRELDISSNFLSGTIPETMSMLNNGIVLFGSQQHPKSIWGHSRGALPYSCIFS